MKLAKLAQKAAAIDFEYTDDDESGWTGIVNVHVHVPAVIFGMTYQPRTGWYMRSHAFDCAALPHGNDPGRCSTVHPISKMIVNAGGSVRLRAAGIGAEMATTTMPVKSWLAGWHLVATYGTQ